MVFWLSLVFLFILPFLDGGTSFLAEILILILPLPLFLLGLSRNEFNLENLNNKIIWPLIIFLASIFISVIFSSSLLFSIPSFFQTLAIFIWFFLFLIIKKDNERRVIVPFICLVSVLLCIVSFYYLLPGVKPPSGMTLVYASYGHSHLADVLLLALPLALALFFEAKDRKKQAIYGLLTLLYIVSFLLTFSRGAFLILPIALIIMFYLFKSRLTVHKLVSGLLISLPLAFLLLIIVFSFSPWGAQIKNDQPHDWLVKQVVKPELRGNRLEYWRQAIEGFKARPLFGYGWGTFELVALKFQKAPAGWSNYTHNFYLQVLAEAGIFAFLSIFTFLFLAIRQIWQLVKKNRGDILLVGGFVAILASTLHSLLDFDWHFPAVFLLFLLLLANLLKETFSRQNAEVGTKIFSGTKPFGESLKLPSFLKNFVSPRILTRVTPKLIILFLSFLLFLFGQSQVLGEYFTQKGEIEKGILLSPWPTVRVRKIGSKIFTKNFKEGEKLFGKIMLLSREDPSMNFWLADRYYYHSEPVKAAVDYQQAFTANPLGNFYLYPRLGKIYEQLGQKDKMDSLYQYFANNLIRVTVEKEDKQLAKVLYEIGDQYYKEGREGEALFWWQKAPAWAPKWSYFYIEAASLSLKIGNGQTAKAILNKCIEYESPRIHCREYLDRLDKGKSFEPPGFWQEKIKKISDN